MPPRYSWLQGFVDIITSPVELALRHVVYPARVLVFAVLLYTFVGTAVQYLYSINDGIRAELYEIQASATEKVATKQGLSDSETEKMLEDIKKNLDFSPVRAIGFTLPLAFLGMILFGWLYWLMQRLFNPEPPPVIAIIGLASYGTSITALGSLLSGLMQFAANTTLAAPTLAFLARPLAEHASLYQFLSTFSLFTLWEYLVVGVVVARHVGMSNNQGLAIGATVLIIRLLLGLIPWAIGKAFGY